MESQNQSNGEIAFTHVMNIFWKKKGFIFIGTATITILSFVIAFFIPKVYKSEGFVSLNHGATSTGLSKGLEIPVYNSYSNIFTNTGHLKKYIKFNKFNDFSNGDDLTNYNWNLENSIQPLYGYDKTERIKSMDNFILGIKISCLGKSAVLASKMCQIVGNFICTSILNLKIGEYVEKSKLNLEREIVKNRQFISKSQFAIEILKEKEQFILTQLMNIYGSKPESSRDIVTIDEKTSKFLSPRQQLVAVKVDIQSNQQGIKRINHENEINRITLDFLNKILPLINNDDNFLANNNLLTTILEEMDQFFKEKKSEEEQQSFYRMTLAFTKFTKLKKIVYRYVNRPTLPKKPIKPRIMLISSFSFILSLLFFAFLAIVIEWWQKNKSMIIQ